MISQEILDKVFIYPTDTVYGIGCDAENKKLVEKIREIKGRDQKPFSVIAPSKEWIIKNFETSPEELKKFLPGPYTLLLKKKDRNFLKNVSNNERIGIRIPKHEFVKDLQSLGKPIVTTSVNFSGDPPANKIDDIPDEIKSRVDEIFDYGELSGKTSTLVKDGELIERK